MPIAALPEYIGKQDLASASPGMRFGMYLRLWGENRELKKIDWRTCDRTWNDKKKRPGWEDRENKVTALKGACELQPGDKARMRALVERQQALAFSANAGDEVVVFDALATAPFTTGLGNEHPLENGFTFLWPHGLPYLPGSGVKGVLRQAARELASGEWGDPLPSPPPQAGEGVTGETSHAGEGDESPSPSGRGVGERAWDDAAITALFGNEDSNDAKRGALTFWDVIPDIKGNKLMVEVMTGHQGHYYMKGETPHESGQPIPVNYLTVPPKSGFTFHVVCDRPFLRRIAPDLEEGDRWKDLLQQAFEHAFDWLGFGAKTAVGYGAMRIDESAAQEREEQAKQQAFEQLTAEEQQVAECRSIFTDEQNRGQLMAGSQTAQKRLALLHDAWTWENPEYRRKAAELIRETLKSLPWSKKQKKQGIAGKLEKLVSGA